MDQGKDVSQPLSAILRELCTEDRITVGEIVDRFGRRAFGALLFIFSTPNLLPLPPGSSTLLGAPLVLLSPQVALGVHAPWLPRFVDDREISGTDLTRFFGRLLPAVERFEKISRPRLLFLFGAMGDRLIGLVCTLLALVLILPIPFGNLLPALTIGVLAFSLVQRDGFFALLGYGLAAASGAVLFLAADVVIDAVRHLVNWFGGA
jgi:hypothetical protein